MTDSRPSASGPTSAGSEHKPSQPPPTDAASITDPTRVEPTSRRNPASNPDQTHFTGPRFEAGAAFGVYQLEKKLGEGGMGAVWKALHTRLDKHVALKVLPPHFMSDPLMIARFDREMKAVGKLDHPHIVRAMDAGEFQGMHFLAMEYLDGVDLAHLVRQSGPRPIAEACEMLRQAALGLAYAHQNGLIHRDIKPTNLFLAKPGKIKILDLGLARIFGESATANSDGPLTQTGQVLGTPEYMSPEQWDDTHTADGRADLYALGCTLFYLLVGREPYNDPNHNSLVRKMKGHTTEPPPDLRAHRADVPEALDAVYQRLMAKKPSDRYANGSELATVLLGIIKQLTGAASSASTPVALPPPPKPAPAAAPVRDKPPPTAGKKPVKSPPSIDTEWEPDPDVAPAPRGRTLPPRRAGKAAAPSHGARHASQRNLLMMLVPGVAVVIALVIGVGYALSKRGNEPKVAQNGGQSPEKTEPSKPSNASINPALSTGDTSPSATPGETKPPADTKPSTVSGPPARVENPVTPDLQPEPFQFKAGDRLSPTALVSRPAAISGLRSWSIEPMNPSGMARVVGVSRDGRFVATWGVSDCAIRLWESIGDPPHSFRLKNVLFGHSIIPGGFSFSPDAKYLVSSSNTGMQSYMFDSFIWDVQTGRRVKTVQTYYGMQPLWSPDGSRIAIYGPYGLTTVNLRTNQTREFRGTGGDAKDYPLVISASWSPGGTQLVTGGRKIRYWQSDTLGLVHDGPSNEKAPYGIAWSPDGRRIATLAPSQSIEIWDAQTHALIRKIDLNNQYGGPPWISWLPDSKRIAAVVPPRPYVLYDAETGQSVTETPPGVIPNLQVWTQDGRYAISTSYEYPGNYAGSVQLRDGDTWGVRASVPRAGRVEFINAALSADGRRLAANNYASIVAFDARTGRLIRRWLRNDYSQLAWAPDGKLLAGYTSSSSSSSSEGSLSLYDPTTDKVARPLANQELGTTLFAWSFDGASFATINTDGNLRIWRTSTMKVTKTIDGMPAETSGLAWSPDGKQLATLANDGTVQIVDAAQSKVVSTHKDISVKDSSRSSNSMAFSPDSQRLFVVSDSQVKSLDLKTGKVAVRKAAGEKRSIRWIQPGPGDRDFLTVRSGDMQFEFAGKETRTISAEGAPMYSFDEQRVLVSVYGGFMSRVNAIVSYDIQSGAEIGSLLPLIAGDNHLCVSADGHYSGSADIDQHIVYTALHDDGSQAIYTPAEFARKFGWKNDSLKPTLTNK